jgi:hypothetical protein
VGVGPAVGVYVKVSPMSVGPKLRIAREHRAEALLVNLRQMSVLWGILSSILCLARWTAATGGVGPALGETPLY